MAKFVSCWSGIDSLLLPWELAKARIAILTRPLACQVL
jgi:hypothetical protein